MLPIPIRSEIHNGNPRWHSAMVSSVISCQNSVEEVLNKYLQEKSIPIQGKTFSKKIDLCSSHSSESFPKAACHELRRLRNLCAHERAKSSDSKQREILCSLHAIDALLNFPQEQGDQPRKKSFSTISIFLCESILESLEIDPPPFELGSIFDGPSATWKELEEYFLETPSGS